MTAPPDLGTLVDTNVLVDVITNDRRWAAWSSNALADAADAGEIAINPIIYAELAVGFTRIEDLNAAVPDDTYKRLEIPWPGAFLASRAFAHHLSRRGRVARAPLPDFLIGAHAAVTGMRLLTRDPRRYRTYFPSVTLLTPARVGIPEGPSSVFQTWSRLR